MKPVTNWVARGIVTAGILAAATAAWAATELPNVALKKPATASASEDNNPPENAVDGDTNTRWCNADEATGCWWRVDLEKAQSLGGCEIMWEHDGANYKYVIEGSADGKTWTLLNDQRGGTETTQIQKLKLADDSVRYVRIMVSGLEDGSWASFFEFKIYDSASMKKLSADEAKAFHASVPVKAPVTASAPAK